MHYNPLLALLDGVKKTGGNSYVARCPAHDDKSPSLAVSVAEDGRILMHCFAGCSTSDVMSSLGLGLADLFPEGAIDNRLRGATPWIRPERKKSEDTDEHNKLILAAAKTDRQNGKRLTPAQLKEERAAWLALKGKSSEVV